MSLGCCVYALLTVVARALSMLDVFQPSFRSISCPLGTLVLLVVCSKAGVVMLLSPLQPRLCWLLQECCHVRWMPCNLLKMTRVVVVTQEAKLGVK